MTKQLFLRTTDAEGKSYNGFQWPMEVGATVSAHDWNDTPECGHGLHGLLHGEGDYGHLSFADNSVWWIVQADNAIDLNGKHKFQTCTVVMFGSRADVTAEMHRRTGAAVHGLIASCCNRSTLTGGDWSTLTGGNWSTLTGGYGSTLTGGDWSTLIFLSWRDGRRRVLTGYVGESGIKPNIAYRASDNFTQLIEA